MKNREFSKKISNAKWVGLLFILAFLAYGVGRSLFESGNATEQYIGSFLIVANSMIVLLIGVLLRKTLLRYNEIVGNSYLITRVFEAIALASIVLSLIPSFQISNDVGYFLAMLVLGLGSIPMCIVLYKHEIVPKWLALWGACGYAILAFGFFMELLGKNWSMYLLAPGGLWEVTFAIWLIIKGGRET